MPGRIIAVLVEPGAEVTKGQPLIVMEAMKMEHTIKAPAEGRSKDPLRGWRSGRGRRRTDSSSRRQHMALPNRVKIVEVGPRDGLQNEKTIVPLAVKVELIDPVRYRLAHDQAAPSHAQMGSADGRHGRSTGRYPAAPDVGPVLAPNTKEARAGDSIRRRGGRDLRRRLEAFSARNINCSIAESLERFRPVAEAALAQGICVRYVSCVLGCPYQGEVPVAEVARVSKALLDLGCYEISLGDTIGAGTAQGADADRAGV